MKIIINVLIFLFMITSIVSICIYCFQIIHKYGFINRIETAPLGVLGILLVIFLTKYFYSITEDLK